MSDKYEKCPLKEAGFGLLELAELPPIIIGPDDKCICTISSKCINVDKKGENRCTLKELEQLSREASYRRGWQSGGDY